MHNPFAQIVACSNISGWGLWISEKMFIDWVVVFFSHRRHGKHRKGTEGVSS